MCKWYCAYDSFRWKMLLKMHYYANELTLVGIVDPMKYPQACAQRDVATIVARNNVALVGSSGLSVSQYDSTT